jgi:hypothetical protein
MEDTDYMVEAIQRYVEHGLQPGHFLLAVLQNDLYGACARADLVNRHRIFEIVQYLYNEVPSACWGSKEKVAAWLVGKQKSCRCRCHQGEAVKHAIACCGWPD